MKLGLLILAPLAMLCAAGCRADPNRELMEREHRELEDQIYCLQDQLADCHRQLDAARAPKGAILAPGAPVDQAPPRVIVPGTEFPQIPKIDLGTPEPPPSEAPVPTPKDQSLKEDKAPPAKSDSPRNSARSSRFGAQRLSHEAEWPSAVERIAINPLFSGGHHFGSKPGDDGLSVVFAARDAQGQSIEAQGEVSIVVIDPNISGSPRIAKWDFSPAEVATHYHRGPFGDAYRFELIWPQSPPEHNELQLYVRMTTPEGARFDTDQTIHVKLAGDAPQAWTKPGSHASQWAPATLPSGAQFDPAVDTSILTATIAPRKPLPSVVPAAPTDDDKPSEPPPAPAHRRPTWSPNR